MTNRTFMTVEEVAAELGVSKSYAYKIVKQLNDELQKLGSGTGDYGSETKKNFRTDQECNFPERKKTKLMCKNCYDGD